MRGGTEAFPDLGKHCQYPDCNQLDFLPFNCNGCQKVFCTEHRSCKSHECPKPNHNSRKVVVCNICSISIETTGEDEKEEKIILERHEKSGNCDPSKKKKPCCPVKRCKQILTFSNTTTCKFCNQKVCLQHRFPTDHVCKKPHYNSTVAAAAAAGNGGLTNKFMISLAARNGKDCGEKSKNSGSSSDSARPPSVKAH